MRAVPDTTREGAGHGAVGLTGVIRHASERGLVTCDSGEGRGQADRATAVGTDGEGAQARRHRGCRTTARAAGRARRIAGVAGDAERARVRDRYHRQLGHRRLAQDDRAGFAQTRGHGRVVRRPRNTRGRASARARHPGDIDMVLDRNRHAVERAERRAGAMACLAGTRSRECRWRGQLVVRNQARIDAADSCVHCVRHLNRREGAGTVSGREFIHRAETQRVIARIVKPLVHRSVIAQSSLDCHSTDTYAPPRYACQTAGSPASAVAVSDFTTSPDSIT